MYSQIYVKLSASRMQFQFAELNAYFLEPLLQQCVLAVSMTAYTASIVDYNLQKSYLAIRQAPASFTDRCYLVRDNTLLKSFPPNLADRWTNGMMC